MPRKKEQLNLPNIQETEPPQNKYKAFRIFLTAFIICAVGWKAYNYSKTQAAINEYETVMNKRSYDPCGAIDEEGSYSKIEDWKDTDPEFQGLPRNEFTGQFEPLRNSAGKIIKDVPAGYPGIKTMQIAWVRGFRWSDGYGSSDCRPCSEAKTPEEISICNNKYLYTNMTISGTDEAINIADIDKADISLVTEILNNEEIEKQQNRVWTDAMKESGALSSEAKEQNEIRGY